MTTQRYRRGAENSAFAAQERQTGVVLGFHVRTKGQAVVYKGEQKFYNQRNHILKILKIMYLIICERSEFFSGDLLTKYDFAFHALELDRWRTLSGLLCIVHRFFVAIIVVHVIPG